MPERRAGALVGSVVQCCGTQDINIFGTKSTLPPRSIPKTHGSQKRVFINVRREPRIAGQPDKLVCRNTAGRSAKGPPSSKVLSFQPLPIEPWARIKLASWRHVRVPDHTLWCDPPPRQYLRQQTFQRRDLRLGKRVIATIVQLNAHGPRVDVALPVPLSCPCMPGTIRLAHHLPQRSVLPDQVMRRHLGHRVTQPLQRRRSPLHRGVVNHHQRRGQTIPTRTKIRRGVPDGACRIHCCFSSGRHGGTARDPRRRRSHPHPGPGSCGRVPARHLPETRSGPDRARQSPRNCAATWPVD